MDVKVRLKIKNTGGGRKRIGLPERKFPKPGTLVTYWSSAQILAMGVPVGGDLAPRLGGRKKWRTKFSKNDLLF